MKNSKSRIKMSTLLWLIIAVTFISGELCLPQAMAQVPARFYSKTLSGANAVPLIYETISGNTNPFDPSHNVSAGAEIDATMTMAGYAKVFPLFDRSAMAAVIVPMGNISGEVNFAGNTYKQSSNGFGDPMLEFDINIIGPKAQNSLPDILRYEPGFSVDLLADLAIPVGDYDNDQPLNIGQNRWYGRVGMPIILQIGSWVPGQRTTLEFLPAAWFFGTNDDYVGQTLETDPMYQLDISPDMRLYRQVLGSARRSLLLSRQIDRQRCRGGHS